MNELISSSAAQPSMSSREMATITRKRHDSVKRTIETLVSRGVIACPQSRGENSVDVQGRQRTTKVYVFASERDYFVALATVSPSHEIRIIERLRELEAQHAKSVRETVQNIRAWVLKHDGETP